MPDNFAKQESESEPYAARPSHSFKAEPNRHTQSTVGGTDTARKDPSAPMPDRHKKDVRALSDVINAIDDMGVLADRKLCLKLVAHLAERVGYQCAGYTEAITVAELMLMSARASELADRLDETDVN